MDWMRVFSPHILDRGMEYFEDGQVVEFSVNGKKISAEVEGNHDYQVEIELGDDKILDMYCDCPFGEAGCNCKHMAAVLFRYEEYLSEHEEDDLAGSGNKVILGKPEQKSEVETLVEKIPEADLRDIFAGILRKDEALYNKLKLTYDFKMDDAFMEKLKKQCKKIISKYGGRYNYIEWHEASEYTGALCDFLYSNMSFLLDHDCNAQAFELVNMVFYEIGTRDMDDSDGESGDVLRECYDYWDCIWDNSNDAERQIMRDWFTKHIGRDYVIDYAEDYMIEFYDEHMLSKEEIEERIEELDLIIQADEDKNESGYIYSMYSGTVSAIMKRMEYMEMLDLSEEEIKKYMRGYRQFSEIREWEVEQAITAGDKMLAIEILEESKLMDAESAFRIYQYSERLIPLYKDLGMKEKLKEELIYQLLHTSQHDLKYYREYKLCASSQDELDGMIEKILAQVKDPYFICTILSEEKRYDELMAKVEENRVLFLADSHEEELKKAFPDRMMQYYIDYITSEMDRASCRNAYRHLVQYLKKVSKYPNGKEKACEIADQWRVTYKRRTAMKEELMMAGF